MRTLQISALALAFLVVQGHAALAEETHTHLGAHEHGAGEMMMVLDGNELLVEFNLPGMDVVGFEHAPENQDQHAAIDKAVDTLKIASNMVELPAAAKCAAEDAHITAPFGEDQHADAEHEHDKEHAHEEKAAEHEHEGEMHAEFKAEYHFHCEAPQMLDSVNVKAFSAFPSLNDIDYQAVVPKAQLGGELEPDNTKISFE